MLLGVRESIEKGGMAKGVESASTFFLLKETIYCANMS